MGKIIGVQAPAKILAGKDLDKVKKLNYAVFAGAIEADPVANVLFRPEEVHGASGITDIFVPIIKRNSHMPHDTFRFDVQ